MHIDGPRQELILEHRLGEDVALHRIAAHRLQDVGLRHVSTASATTSQPTPLISWITAWTITRAFRGSSMSAISDGSSLTRSSGIARKPRNVRIAGAEIVDCDPRTSPRKAAISVQDGIAGLHRRGLGELEFDQARGHIGVGEGVASLTKKSGAVDLARADVEAPGPADAVAAPVAEQSRALPSAPNRRSRR